MAARSTAPADQVQAFYDDHPYPPPVASLDRYHAEWRDPNRLRVEYHLVWPKHPYREELEILVAGCGTSQAAKHAIRQPAARVTGIDVSETSLRHTRELKRKYNLENLEIHPLAIEQAHELGRRFDKVVCTGVLHHLADPDVGLRALRAVLKPDGALYLMVYAPYGRTGVYMLQEYCRRLGVDASTREVDDLVAVLRTLPNGHPLAHVLRESSDMRSRDALADALLHPRDRAYSVPQLLEYLERNGCRFGRWYRQAQYVPHCGALAGTPHAARLAALPPREQYAAVELYRGTIARHSFVAYRDDYPDRDPLLSPGSSAWDEGWQGCVPIRQPRTICVRENLPPGAAGVLINQAHTYTDLILPIDRYEQRLYLAIDGRRCVAEIVEGVPTSAGLERRQARARAFFERLWWYDQVVFDASRTARPGGGM